MAEFQQQHHQNQPNLGRPTTDPFTAIIPDNAPSPSHLLALLTLLPIGAFLLFLSGISFIGTVIALAVSSPLFVIFSPILVPAVLVIAFAVAGFLTSGAFGLTALSSLSWMANYLRRSRVPLQLDQAKQWVRQTAAQAAQTAREAGQAIQSKAQEGDKTDEVIPVQEGGMAEGVPPVQEGGRTEQGEGAQEQGTVKDEAAEEAVKTEESGKAQEGKAQKGKARGGSKT